MNSVPLYLASSNPGKLRESRNAAALRGVVIEALPGFSDLPTCVEDGATFRENACKKALHYGRMFEGLVFADDSGICLNALHGAPGIHSARYAGPAASDRQNNEKMLRELHRAELAHSAQSGGMDHHSLPGNRAAHYICVIALAERDRILAVVEGRADGLIVDQPRGSGGFGYDPYFLYPALGRTFAELTAEEKFAVSHRGAAFNKLIDYQLEEGR